MRSQESTDTLTRLVCTRTIHNTEENISEVNPIFVCVAFGVRMRNLSCRLHVTRTAVRYRSPHCRT